MSAQTRPRVTWPEILRMFDVESLLQLTEVAKGLLRHSRPLQGAR